MLLGTAVLSAGCAGQAEKEDEGKEEVSIPIILTVDSSTGIKTKKMWWKRLMRNMTGNGRRTWSGSWRRKRNTGRT